MTKEVYIPDPVGDRVIVRMDKEVLEDGIEKHGSQYEKKSTGGIILETISESKLDEKMIPTQRGVVVRNGIDAYKMLGSGYTRAAVGDIVSVVKHSGYAVRIEDDLDNVYRVLSDEDIIINWSR